MFDNLEQPEQRGKPETAGEFVAAGRRFGLYSPQSANAGRAQPAAKIRRNLFGA
jgi:hypothetical protein